MICQNCLKRLARQSSASHPFRRAFSQATTRPSIAATAQATTTTNPRPNDIPAATSTSAAQPFSTPLSPSTPRMPPAGNPDAPPRPPRSSVPGGTVLRGLNFMKNQSDPVALEDHEYPEWLWGVLEAAKAKGKGDAGSEGDLFSKSKKQRRAAAKVLRKRSLQDPNSLTPKIPLQEQSIDLPAGDGTVDGAVTAADARTDLTRALREQRRAKIKESNFLKAMR